MSRSQYFLNKTKGRFRSKHHHQEGDGHANDDAEHSGNNSNEQHALAAGANARADHGLPSIQPTASKTVTGNRGGQVAIQRDSQRSKGRGLEPGGWQQSPSPSARSSSSNTKKKSKQKRTLSLDNVKSAQPKDASRSLYHAAVAGKSSGVQSSRGHNKRRQQQQLQQQHSRRPLPDPRAHSAHSSQHGGAEVSLPTSPSSFSQRSGPIPIDLESGHQSSLLFNDRSRFALQRRSSFHNAGEDEDERLGSSLLFQPKQEKPLVDVDGMASTLSTMSLSQRLQIPAYILSDVTSLLHVPYEANSLGLPEEAPPAATGEPDFRTEPNEATPKHIEVKENQPPRIPNRSAAKSGLRSGKHMSDLQPLSDDESHGSPRGNKRAQTNRSDQRHRHARNDNDADADDDMDDKSLVSALDMTADASFSVGSSRPARVHVYRDGHVEIKPKLTIQTQQPAQTRRRQKRASRPTNVIVSNLPSPSRMGNNLDQIITDLTDSLASPGNQSRLTHLGIEQTHSESLLQAKRSPSNNGKKGRGSPSKGGSRHARPKTPSRRTQRGPHVPNRLDEGDIPLQTKANSSKILEKNLDILPENEEAHFSGKPAHHPKPKKMRGPQPVVERVAKLTTVQATDNPRKHFQTVSPTGLRSKPTLISLSVSSSGSLPLPPSPQNEQPQHKMQKLAPPSQKLQRKPVPQQSAPKPRPKVTPVPTTAPRPAQAPVPTQASLPIPLSMSVPTLPSPQQHQQARRSTLETQSSHAKGALIDAMPSEKSDKEDSDTSRSQRQAYGPTTSFDLLGNYQKQRDSLSVSASDVSTRISGVGSGTAREPIEVQNVPASEAAEHQPHRSIEPPAGTGGGDLDDDFEAIIRPDPPAFIVGSYSLDATATTVTAARYRIEDPIFLDDSTRDPSNIDSSRRSHVAAIGFRGMDASSHAQHLLNNNSAHHESGPHQRLLSAPMHQQSVGPRVLGRNMFHDDELDRDRDGHLYDHGPLTMQMNQTMQRKPQLQPPAYSPTLEHSARLMLDPSADIAAPNENDLDGWLETAMLSNEQSQQSSGQYEREERDDRSPVHHAQHYNDHQLQQHQQQHQQQEHQQQEHQRHDHDHLDVPYSPSSQQNGELISADHRQMIKSGRYHHSVASSAAALRVGFVHANMPLGMVERAQDDDRIAPPNSDGTSESTSGGGSMAATTHTMMETVGGVDSETIPSRCWTVDSRGKLFESEDEDDEKTRAMQQAEDEALVDWLEDVISAR